MRQAQSFCYSPVGFSLSKLKNKAGYDSNRLLG